MSLTVRIVAAALPLLVAVPASAQDAGRVIADAVAAMGTGTLRTVQYSATGFLFVFGQSASPGAPWPRFAAKTYTREIDFDAPASRVQLVRTSLDARGGGGTGLPIVDQRQTQVIAPGAAWAQQVDIWLTPHGFLKAAVANDATVRAGSPRIVTFTAQNKYRVNGYINDQNLVERVETWLEHPALGDMPIEVAYSGYRSVAGVMFPTRIVQSQGGFPVLDITVSEVRPNAPVVIEAGQGGRGGAGTQGVTVRSIKAADGVFYIIGGPNNSIAVEFSDHIVMIEAPQTEERSLAFIAEAKRQIPGKPIKYVVNTHHHFDHSGGLRAFSAEGATIVTHAINRPYYEKALNGPRTLAPDRLALSGRTMAFETFTDRKVLTDGARTIELHLIAGTPHTDGSIMAYLPAERLLIEGDIFDSPGPGVPAITEGPKTAANLIDNIERLKLRVERLLPVHAADIVPVEQLYRFAQRELPPS
jgi:glyoxylase-like metal-dependent hydrolase (beta-lactamase superfamily II)